MRRATVFGVRASVAGCLTVVALVATQGCDGERAGPGAPNAAPNVESNTAPTTAEPSAQRAPDVAAAGLPSEPPPAKPRTVRVVRGRGRTMAVVGTAGAQALDAVGPLAAAAEQVESLDAVADTAVFVVATETQLRDLPLEHVRGVPAHGALLFVDEWSGDEEWLRSLVPGGTLRPLVPGDAVLARPTALTGLPPAHSEPDATLVGIEERGEIRIVATRQNTLCHECSCDKADGRAKFGRNLAAYGAELAARSRPRPAADPAEIRSATLAGRHLRAEAVVRNDTPVPSVARLQLVPREGPVVAAVSRPLAPGASDTLVLEIDLPQGFDVVEHRLVASREDDATVDRAVAPLAAVAGAADVVVLHTGKVAPGTAAAVRVLARNARTGAPVEGCPVTLEFVAREGSVARGTTDAAGTATLSVDVPETVPPGAASWVATLTGPLVTDVARTDTTVAETTGGHLFLDTPIHRPGDVVRFRVLAVRRPSGRPAAGIRIPVEVADLRDRRSALQTTVTTDERGVGAGEVRLPADAPSGDHGITAAGFAHGTFRVERFETPAFSVTVEPSVRVVRAGGALSGSVTARRFDGAPMPLAEVSVALRGDAFAAPPVARWEGTTDLAGRATYAFSVPAGAADGGTVLDVRVLDAGGRSVRTVERLVPAGPTAAAEVRASFPNGELTPGRPGRIVVETNLPAGSEVEAAVGRDAPQKLTVDDFGLLDIDVAAPSDDVKIVVAGRTLHVGANSPAATLSVGPRLVAEGAEIPVRAFVDDGSQHVLVDVVSCGAIVATHSIRVVDGVAAARISLPAGLTGDIVVQASTTAGIGVVPPVGCAIAVVPAERLRMTITPTAADVRPGDTVGLDVCVTDTTGAGVPSAFALRVVDEAVLSLAPRPLVVGRVAAALGDRFNVGRRPNDVPGVAQLASTATRRPLTRSEARLADVLLARGEAASPLRATARSLPARRAEYERRVAVQFAAFAAEFRRKAAAALEGDRSPAPSAEVPDVVTALRVAAARGAFGPDGLVDPWGTPLRISGPTGIPFGTSAATPGDNAAANTDELTPAVRVPFRMRSDGPDARPSLHLGTNSRSGTSGLRLERDEPPPPDDDDADEEWTEAETYGLHAVWVRRHGYVFDDAAFTERVIGIGGGAGGAFGGRRGGHRSLKAGGGGRTSEVPADDEVRIRRAFPASILFTPLVLTGPDGRARVDVATGDSVTTWRAEGVAHDAAGRIADGEARFRATLPFVADADAPPALFVGDEVRVPVVLRWTGADRADVVADVTASGPLEILESARTTLRPGAHGECAVFVRVRATGAGTARLTVRCTSGSARDAVEREIDVRAPGFPACAATSFRTDDGRAELTIARPASALRGSERLELRIFGGALDGVLGGVDGLLQTPHGCFEQASSTLFPDVLALTYLERAGGVPAETRRRFDAAIREGTDLLLTYEIPGGGFDWFGRPPAKLLLSAYGAHEWWMLHALRRANGTEDRRAGDGAGAVAMRTTRWLVSQQRADGSFPAEGAPYEWHGQTSTAVAATAYVGWALTHARNYDESFAAALTRARTFVLEHAGDCTDPYGLALVSLFLAESGGEGVPESVVARLAQHVRFTGGAARVAGGSGSALHGRGATAAVEATALAALAARRIARADVLDPSPLVRALVEDRRGDGTWGTTQATVLALWAILDSAESAVPDGTEVLVRAGGLPERRVLVDGSRGTGAVTIDLSAALASPPPCRVSVERVGGGPLSGTLTIPHVAAWPAAGRAQAFGPAAPVTVRADFPRTARVGERVFVAVTIRNASARPVEMPIVVVPLPAGFTADGSALRAARTPGGVERIETDSDRAVLYLRAIPAGASVDVALPVTPRLRGRITVAPAEARPYYEPDATWRAAPSVVVVE